PHQSLVISFPRSVAPARLPASTAAKRLTARPAGRLRIDRRRGALYDFIVIMNISSYIRTPSLRTPVPADGVRVRETTVIERDTIFIDGKWVGSAGTGTLTVVNPATEEPIATVPRGDADDV